MPDIDDLTYYKVILKGEVVDGFDRSKVISNLNQLFHSKSSYTQNLLEGKEVSLKKEYRKTEASNICRAIRDAGAQCKIQPIGEEELTVSLDDNSPLVEVEKDLINCPNCDQVCYASWKRCKHCSTPLSVSVYEDSDISIEEDDEEEAPPSVIKQSPREYSVEDQITDFVGPNARYYLSKFKGMGSVSQPKPRLSWHWPAFFFFFVWSMYRKLWLLTVANVAGAVVLSQVSSSVILLLGYGVVWATLANYLYFQHVAKHLRRNENQISAGEQRKYLKSSGGVHRIAMWVGIAVLLWAMIHSGFQVASQFSNAHENQFGESIQLRGNGQQFILTEADGEELETTSKVLETLSSALKIVVVGGGTDNVAKMVDALRQRSANNKLIDGWGTPISILNVSTEGDAKVTFRSAGPDGIENSADDLTQTIKY